jgi:hypothetical protein
MPHRTSLPTDGFLTPPDGHQRPRIRPTRATLLIAAAITLGAPLMALPAAAGQEGTSTGRPTTAAPPTRDETDRLALLLRLPKPNPAGFIGDPYPLDTCIVAGEKLGEKAVTLILKDQRDALQEGRHLRFCCEACLEKFKANPTEYLAKLDAEIIRLQKPQYPLERCLVMLDETLGEDTEDFVYGNRCYVLCCRKCENNFLKSAGRYVTTYDKAVTGRQRQTYPLDTCIVSGKKLSESKDGKPYDLVIGSRLFRLHSEAEAKVVLENASAYLAKLPPLKSAKPQG